MNHCVPMFATNRHKGVNILDSSYGDRRNHTLEIADGYGALGIIPLSVEGTDTVAFLSTYLDESYGEGHERLFVGGFVSTIDRWATFANRWSSDVQQRFNIPHFHTIELMSDNHRIYRHLDNEDRVRLFSTALDIIKAQTDFAVVCSINPKEYLAITTPKERSFYGTAYTIVVMACYQAISRYIADNMVDAILSIYLEDGHRNTNQALDILREEWRFQQEPDWPTLDPDTVIYMRLGTVAPGTKAQMNPLQAADLLTYSIAHVYDPRFRAVVHHINEAVPIFDFNLESETIRRSLNKAG